MAWIVGACGIGLLGAAAWAWVTDAGKPATSTTTVPVFSELTPVAPVMRTIATAEGTLIEMRVPVDRLQIGVTEDQICYVWRDKALQTASLACPSEGRPTPD